MFKPAYRRYVLPKFSNSLPHEFGEMLEPRRGDNIEIDRATGTLSRSSYFLARNRCIYLEARIYDLKFVFRSFTTNIKILLVRFVIARHPYTPLRE